MLRAMARVLGAEHRDVDLSARLGGDEFAVLMPNTDADDAARVLRRVAEAFVAAMRGRDLPVTCSAGAVTFHAAPAGVADLLAGSDAALYRVKTSGRGQVRVVAGSARAAAEAPTATSQRA